MTSFGTAHLLEQVSAFHKLKMDYGPAVAEALMHRNLQKNGVNATIDHVRGWDMITEATLRGKCDIEAEVQLAEERAAIAAGAVIAKNAVPTCSSEDEEWEGEEFSDPQEDDCHDEELSSLGDLYGYSNSEDNEEAALDDVLKIQENA